MGRDINKDGTECQEIYMAIHVQPPDLLILIGISLSLLIYDLQSED